MGQGIPRPVSSLQYAVAVMPLPGETECGDHYLVVPTPSGVLMAVVDGVGHGAEAARAARVAVETMLTHAEEPVISLIRRCHERMRSTRGAVMNLASIRDLDSTVTWLSVGNVEGVLLRAAPTTDLADETILKRGGVVGFRLPHLEPMVVPVFPGDTLIFATDGIHPGFEKEVRRRSPPQRIADLIFRQNKTGADDALVLVARYLGR